MPKERGRPEPDKLAVLAADVADAVNAAGGVIFDRVSAGWRVAVYLEAPGDDRPLRILGAEAHPLPGDLDDESEWPDFVLVAADVHGRNTDVRRFIATAVRSRRAAVAVWESDRPSEPEKSSGRVDHRLSTAAQAFKAHAICAAGLTSQVSPTESFRNRGR